jgi:glycosyltransferase involved in cell wall biosynthesis
MSSALRSLQIGKSWLPEAGANGLDRMFYGLYRSLPKVGVAVDAIVAGSEDVQSEAVEAGTGAVRSFAPESVRLSRRLYRARATAHSRYQQVDPDLIACHFALYAAPLLDLLSDTPTVFHFHGPWASESAAEGEPALKTQLKAWLERRTYRTADRFIVLSEAFRDVLCSNYAVPADRVRIVPGGVDADRFAVDRSPQASRRRLGWPIDRPIILSVRRLARRMGLSNLIAAMQPVVRHHPNALLLIAGKGPMRSNLEDRIDALGLRENVRLIGFVPEADLPYAYRAADLSVVPTVEHEGFGLITAESLATGTPVLVTPVGGLPETVRGLSRDLILADSSRDAIGTGLRRALDEPASLPGPDRCIAYARSRFDWPAIARQVRTVYEEVA